MKINNYGLPQISNTPQHKNATIKDKGGTVSFQSFLQERIHSQDRAEQPRIDGIDIEINKLYELDSLEAIAARARVQQNASGDVSDFLEIIKKNQYLFNGVDVDSQPPLNSDSMGKSSLTAEQADALRQKYNINNLSPQEQYSLFQKLTELGVLTKDDVQKTQLSVTPEADDLMEHIANEPNFKDVLAIAETNPKGRLDAMIHNERFAYNHVQQRFGRHCGNVADLADSHQRVLDTLNQI